MFLAADKLRQNLEPSDYKHVVLGLVFLKHVSVAFEAKHAELLAEDPEAAEDPDEYMADRVFWVPQEARWSHLQANAKLPTRPSRSLDLSPGSPVAMPDTRSISSPSMTLSRAGRL